MATIQQEDLYDLSKMALAELGRYSWEDYSATLQHYEVFPRIMSGTRRKVSSGNAIRRNLMFGTSGSAQMVGLYNTDATSTPKLMNYMTIPWRHMSSYYQWERREVLMDSAAAQIVDLIVARRHANIISEAELYETQFTSKPADSTDNLNAYGFPMFVVKNNGAGGFTGGNPAGFATGVGGVDSTVYTAFSNYAAGYTNPTKDDLVAKGNILLDKTDWQVPDNYPSYGPLQQDKRLYCNLTTRSALRRLVELQNENLGSVLSPYQDDFGWTNSLKPVWMPKLDSDSSNPLYFFDWNSWEIHFLQGDELHEEPVEKVPNMHNVYRVMRDSTFNFLNFNRRKQGVVSI